MARATPTSLLHLHLLDLPGEEQGAFEQRVVKPVRLLSQDPRFAPAEISWLAPDAPHRALAADILVIHALAGIEMEALIRRRRVVGRVTLFEIGDDLSSPRPWKRRGPSAPRLLDVSRQLLHASIADGVQFSSPALSHRYAELNPRNAVVDNIVEFSPQPPPKPPGFVFGWAGSRSHKDDLAAIATCVTAFCQRHPDVVFALMGDLELYEMFAAVPAAQFMTQPFGPYADYRRFLASLHVGVVPLCDTAFNAGRSDVKIVEMAAEGAAVLAQDAPAFHACRHEVQRFDTTGSLNVLLERLHADRGMLDAVARAGRASLAWRRSEAAILSQHAAWYGSWPVTASGRLPPARPDATALSVRLDEAWKLARSGDSRAALRAGRALLEIDDGYVQARWLVTSLLIQLGSDREALECGASLADCPIFGDFWRALGPDTSLRAGIVIPELRLKPAGTPPETLATYHRQLLAAHPFHLFALAAEHRHLEKAGDFEQAAILRRRLSLIDPLRWAPTDQAVGAS